MAHHQDTSLLEAALVGYQHQRETITAAIADLQKRVGNVGAGGVPAPAGRTPRKKHRISAEGRARIAAAQRRRWAAAKKAN
jgi:hypothetical protein